MVSIKELAPVLETLNEKRNDVNQIIADLNAKLAQLNVGIETIVQSDIRVGGWETVWGGRSGGDALARTRQCVQLGYSKINDKWQLAIFEYEDSQSLDENGVSSDEFESSAGSWTSLLEAPLALRIKALSLVENLVTLMQSQALAEIKAIAEARKLADKI